LLKLDVEQEVEQRAERAARAVDRVPFGSDI